MKLVKCPNCASLISSRAIKEQNKRRGWRRPWFNPPVQCTNCGVHLKLNMASLFLGALFFGFGTYSFLAEESLVNSFIVIGLIFAFFVNCRLGLSHRVTDKPDL